MQDLLPNFPISWSLILIALIQTFADFWKLDYLNSPLFPAGSSIFRTTIPKRNCKLVSNDYQNQVDIDDEGQPF